MAQLFNLRTSQQAGVLFATLKVGSLQLLPPTSADARIFASEIGWLLSPIRIGRGTGLRISLLTLAIPWP
ncbi:hypothetical protein LINPERPRIM_LOCUS11552 [Linum perenne]